MCTGIIEASGKITSVSTAGSSRSFWISSPLLSALKVDQSIAHDGVCLTVESVDETSYQVTAIAETLSKTGLSEWKEGKSVNLERSLKLDGRLDGHLVQGHVDTTAVCRERINQQGSWLFGFEFPASFRNLVIEKGSIAVNGVSLTCFNVTETTFSVAIIPYTFDHTNIRDLFPNAVVNIEFDLIGKYVARSMFNGNLTVDNS
jgi:riboflavin synthase